MSAHGSRCADIGYPGCMADDTGDQEKLVDLLEDVAIDAVPGALEA